MNIGSVEQTTAARPVALKPLFDNIPADLIARPQWVLWHAEVRVGKWTKAPFQADGSPADSTKPLTWAPFNLVRTAYEISGRYDGVGFVLTADDPFVGFDFDHVLDEAGAIIDAKVADYVQRLDSYTEVSPSGTGLRVIVRGRLPEQDRKLGNCECYDDKRFVTITGRRYSR